MSSVQPNEVILSRWYFGGLGSAGAACCTHPLDLIKVHFQTTATNLSATSITAQGRPTMFSTAVRLVKSDGILALYNGLTASLLRQLTYSTTRFGIYEVAKQQISPDGSTIPFYQRIILAGISGAVGGLVGTPADMINVRMQNDMKLLAKDRRNYKNAIDGLIKVYRFEGAKSLFNGASMATARAIMMSIGQLSMYDQFKYLLLKYLPMIFEDNVTTHLTASTLTGAVATSLTQPLDVLKTRMMNSAKNQYRSVGHCITELYKESGIFGFFKGYVPAFIRLAPHTILTFVFMEQLRLNFGIHKLTEG
ncbi:dicarboxylate carrier 1 [Dermatophagoides pteronyssinus]|uniref:dicarboxylate carrier 1 n=1 Tax=Dermatophagoides pteronyssinus TaxID=6956 RepID=UPI003F66F8F2